MFKMCCIANKLKIKRGRQKKCLKTKNVFVLTDIKKIMASFVINYHPSVPKLSTVDECL